ncbi:MAG TPA: hypothetical protein VGJ13_03225 [Pseudonocardiaceae bacterium]
MAGLLQGPPELRRPLAGLHGRYREPRPTPGDPSSSATVCCFDLVLSSHLLFTYGERFDELDRLLAQLGGHGVSSRLRRVDYEFQRGGNEMLILGHAPAGTACR